MGKSWVKQSVDLIPMRCRAAGGEIRPCGNVFPVILTTGLLFLTISASARTYTTNFPVTENPMSEGGMWINGGTVGLDWNNVQTTPGFVGGVGPSSVKYSDPTAILAGSWGPTQTVTATVYSVGTSNGYYQEVELRLRTSISAHSITGYEILFRTPNNSSAYVQIVRWNGALASFTYLGGRCSYPAVCGGVSGIGVANGDVVKATIVGSTINAYINDVLIATATDTTFATGSPGVGFNYGCGSTYSAFGFTSFTATDGSRTSRSQQRRPARQPRRE